MLKVFLFNFLFYFLFLNFALGNREDPNVSNDWGLPNSDENLQVQNIEENDLSIAWDLIEAGEYEASKKLLRDLMNTNTPRPEVWNILGYIERQLQNFENSFEYYKNALSIDNEYIPAHHYIAIAYLESGDLEKAKHHFDQLDLLCLFGCEEFDNLRDAIAMYEENNDL